MRPFEGIRIIDLTHVLAGPFASYQLALLGADVIKVEPPHEPDQTRDQGVNAELRDSKMATWFLAQSSNKRAMTLNLKTEKGREILKRMVEGADVLVENYRPGALDKLGLGYHDLSKINARLIYSSMTAYGQIGARHEQTGYDHIIQANSGIMAMTGTPDINPIRLGVPAVDYASGIAGAYALAAALFHRERTGLGQHIDLAMSDVAMLLMSSYMTHYSYSGDEPKPTSGLNPVATSSAYQTRDGIVMLGASNLRQHRRLWEALERPDMIKISPAERLAAVQEEVDILKQIMLTRTAAEWEDYLQSRHIPAARVRTMAEALVDPHTVARGVVHTHEQVDGVGRPVTVPVAPFRFKHDGPRVDTPPRRFGADTDSILTDLGYSSDDVRLLRESAVI